MDYFELNNIYIVATPKLIEEKDLNAFKDVDSLVDSINLLQSSMDKIENGSKKLNTGLKSAYDGSSLITKKISESINSLDSNEGNVLDEDTLNGIRDKAISGASLSEEELNSLEEKIKQLAKTIYKAKDVNISKAVLKKLKSFDKLTASPFLSIPI